MKQFFAVMLACTMLLGFVRPSIQDKGFSVYERGVLVNKLEIRKDSTSRENIIQIEALNVTGGSVLMGRRNPVLPPAEITSIISINGSYVMSRDIRKSGRGVVTQLLDVIYPYRVRLTISEQIVEFEMKEAGYWKVNIALNQ